MRKETRPLLVLFVWFCFALGGGALGCFRNFSAAGIALLVWTLTALALLLCWKVSNIRAWILSIDLKWLIALHLVRFVGIYFLILANRGALPAGFARPAGIGDILVATLALCLVAVPALRATRVVVIVWNAFGLLDILFVVSSALRFGLHDVQSMLPLRVLPLSLLPAFFVPLIIASHVLMFMRLRRPS